MIALARMLLNLKAGALTLKRPQEIAFYGR